MSDALTLGRILYPTLSDAEIAERTEYVGQMPPEVMRTINECPNGSTVVLPAGWLEKWFGVNDATPQGAD